MAEIAGLVASIIGIAGAGAKLALTLYTIADGIGTAGQEARLVAMEISLFSQSLTAMTKTLERKASDKDRVRDIAQAVTQACESLLDDIRTLLKTLSPSPRSTFSSYCKRVKWVMQKPRVSSMRSSIESFKSTLILLVASMDSAEAALNDAPNGITQPLQVQVETLLKTSYEASNAMINCKRLENSADDSSASSQEDPVQNGDEKEETTKNPEEKSDKPPADPPVTPSTKRKARFASQNLKSKASVESFKSAVTHHGKKVFSDDDIPSSDNTQALVQRVTVMVRQLAVEVLSDKDPVTSWSWIPQDDIPKPDIPPPPRYGGSFSPRYSSFNDSGFYVPPNSEPSRSKSDDPYPYNGQGNPSFRATSPTGKTETSQEQEDQFARLEERLLSRFPDMMQQSLLDKIAEIARDKQVVPKEPDEPIKFKDAVGRKFTFPWHLCKTWRGMEDLVKQAFQHVDVIGPHVHEGHYDLVGPDGEIVMPQLWESSVQPGWQITMHMWPLPEPPKPPPPPPPPMPPVQIMPFPPPKRRSVAYSISSATSSEGSGKAKGKFPWLRRWKSKNTKKLN